jgi:hypothetical protein
MVCWSVITSGGLARAGSGPIGAIFPLVKVNHHEVIPSS